MKRSTHLPIYDKLCPPICPKCERVTYIRSKGNGIVQCESCKHRAQMHEFYQHGQSYLALGMTWQQKISGDED